MRRAAGESKVKYGVPASSLVTPETRVAKAPADVDGCVRRRDEAGVEKSVMFTEAVGAAFDQQTELFLRCYPNRFQLWRGVATSNIGARHLLNWTKP